MKKSFIVGIISFLFLIIGCNGGKAPLVESNVHVWGNCDKCKAAIEKSSKIDGVSDADWSEDSKLLKVKYDTTVVALNTILEAIAKAGYDNEKFYADDYAYNKLPDCCQYDRRPFESK